MRKHLIRPLSKLASTFIDGVPRQCFLYSLSLKTLFHLLCSQPNFKPKYVFFSTSIPPHEWIEPFTDISNVNLQSNQNFQTSIWVSRIVDIVDGAPLMEMNLTDYCNKFIIKLTPNFVAFVLSSTQVNINPDIAFRFFNWAEAAEQVFDVMQNGKTLPDMVTYNTLVKGYCKAGKALSTELIVLPEQLSLEAIEEKHEL